MAILAAITLGFIALVNIFFGLAVLTRTYRRSYGWYFSIALFGVSLWSIGDLGILFAKSPNVVHASSLLFYISPMITPVCMWLFALSFPENRRVPRKALVVGSAAFTLFALLFTYRFDFFIKGISLGQPFNQPQVNQAGFLIYGAYLSLFFILSYIAFLYKMKQLRGLDHTQVRYTFWGVLLGSSLALATNLCLPLLGETRYIWLGPLFTIIFAVIVTMAIIQHRMFDIRLVVARSIGYLLSVISLAALYGLVLFTTLNRLIPGGNQTSFQQQAIYTLLAASLGFTFYPVRRFFEKVTNRVFYRDAYDPQAFLDHFNRTLVANAELKPMLDNVAKIIQDTFKVDFCMFWIGRPDQDYLLFGSQARQFSEEDRKESHTLLSRIADKIIIADTTYALPLEDKMAIMMTRNNVALLARLIADEQLTITNSMGYMVLGNKKSGNPLTNADIKLIKIIVNELVIAIENALRFEEIENFTITLQERIDEATHKLRRTNEKLRTLDETKDDFISMASHQLRTPLTSVKGYVSMVLDGDAGKITPLQRKLLNQSFISSQRMVYLISDLLNVSRLRTGRFIVEPARCNLASIIQEEVEQLVETAKGRGLRLSYEKPTRFPDLMLDETKTRQVIMNFIDNAIYYTPTGGHIVVRLVNKPDSIDFLVIDDGIGVPRAEQRHLFSKFYRAPNAKRARPDGTGLGLFMAKKVVIAQGGAVLFTSNDGEGSTFGFTFQKEGKLVDDTTPGAVE